MKRPPKLWKSRDALIAAIDKAKVKLAKAKDDAKRQDDVAEFFRTEEMPTQYNEAKDKADRLWKKAERLEHKRLKQLGRTLAAFDTKPMFENVEPVELQK